MMEHHKIETEFDRQIDATLRSIGSAVPDPGLEGRIVTRLAAARSGGDRSAHALSRIPHFVVPLAGFASASLVCGVIIVASVNHSHRYHPGMVAPPPILQMQQGGVGAAAAVHPAAPPSAAPVPAGPAARGRSTHKAAHHGRARIAPHAKKAPGIALPASPAGTPQ